MGYLVGLLVLVFGLVVSIALHELGHFVPAKRFGVRVTRYMIGFGPTLWSRVRGETEYGIKAIPLGGYVRMVGMIPSAEVVGARPRGGAVGTIVQEARDASGDEIREGEEHRAFYRLSTPKKLTVMLAGPVMNLVIAAVLMAVVLVGIGLPGSATTTVAAVGDCVLPLDAPADRTCADTDPVAPAAEAGLRPGDVLVSYGGRPVTEWGDFQQAVRSTPGSDIPLVVERDGQQVTLQVSPVRTERPVYDTEGYPVLDDAGTQVTEVINYVGVSPTAATERQSWSRVPSAVGTTVWETLKILVTLPTRLVDVGRAVVGVEERDATGVIGIVGAGRLAGQIGAQDASPAGLSGQVAGFLLLLASLNIALFAFNMIPLLPLDGGHVAGALWEGARRLIARMRGRPRPVPSDIARMMPVAYVVFALLIGMTLLLVVADIVRPVVF